MDEDVIQMDVKDFTDEAQEVAADPTPEESSTEENKSEVAESTDETEGTDEETNPDTKTEDKSDSDSDDTTPDDKPQGKAEERKQQLNTEIRDLVSQRNAIRQEVEKLNSETYQAQSVEDLVNEGMSESDAKVAALEQRLELKDYNERVAEAQLTINHESQKVLTDFPIFNPDSKEFNEALYQKAAATFNKSLIRDPNTGTVIGSHLSPYTDIYQPLYEAHQASLQEGQIKGQKATEQMLASADVPSSASSTKSEASKDSFEEGFDSVT